MGWTDISVAKAKLRATKPKASGKAKVGKRLTAKAGKWTSGTKLQYQWLRNGKTIKGAKKSSYKLVRKDVGKRISVRVTGKKRGYVSVTKTSSKTKKVAR